ncbi:MAG: biotin transporter BioY [Clostridia bacterium]|nr:biotin transporter BioY [Clostridia bacterium]
MSQKINVRDIVFPALFAAIISVLGFVSINVPFSPVPITGQTLGIMLAGCILTTRQAASSVAVFLGLGIIGVPVFAGGTSGPSVLAGPRGGYLIGFLVGAVVISMLKGKGTNIVRLAAANTIGGIIAVYILGILWLSHAKGISLIAALTAGALPFIPGDIFKVAVASLVAVAVNKQLNRLNLR